MTENIDLSKNERVVQGLDSDIEKIYFNGFALSIGTGDVLMVLEKNQKPVVILNASYTVAKTLSKKLNGIIQRLENGTGNKIMTTDDINNAMGEERK